VPADSQKNLTVMCYAARARLEWPGWKGCRNQCKLVGICPMVSARSGWKLVTFDLDLWTCYFRIFLIQAIPFEWLYLATLFSVCRYICRISRPRFSFKIMGPRSRSQQHVTQKPLVGNFWGLIRISATIMLEVIQSFWHFDLWPWDIFVFR